MPDLTHLWQRFLLAISLVVGLLVGAAATVFGYSNLTTVDLRWSIVHISGVPLWTVAVVPLAIVLVAGTIYHWMDSLHHFTEHMRHRRRVHELEGELATLRAHLDQLLEMPDQSTSRPPRKPIATDPAPIATDPAPIATEQAPVAVTALSGAAIAQRVNGSARLLQNKAPRIKRPEIAPVAGTAEPEVATNGTHRGLASEITSGVGGEATPPADPAPEN